MMPTSTLIRRIPSATAIAGLACAAALAVTACSSGGSSSAASSAGGSSSPSSASGTASLRIGYNPNPTNLTILVAQQEGFFAKNGLKVTLTPLQNASAEVPALGKQFDLLTTTPVDVLHAAAVGLKPLVVEGQTQETPAQQLSGLMVGSGITSVADLKGKTIAVPGLAGALYGSLIVTLHNVGLSSTDAKIVQVPFANMFDELKAGQVNAALSIVPYTGQMKAAGFKQIADPILTTTGNQATPSNMWTANSSWAAANSATIAKFRTAQDQALAWIKDNDAAARQILVTSLHLPAAVAKIYPITAYFYFPVTGQSLTNWIKPLETVGLLQQGSVTSADDLVLNGA